MDDLTVMTWLWRQDGGRVAYAAHHVNIWADMVRRHLSTPHRIACVTDMPDGIDPWIDIITPPRDFVSVCIPTWGVDKPQCLRRIALFRPDAADIFGARFVSMDMDCVITGEIAPLFADAADFKMYRGTTNERPYNGSMLMMTAGARSQVYERFTPAAAEQAGRQYVGSDQAWISYVLGRGEATWGVEDGVGCYGSSLLPPPDARRLTFFPGTPKPWQLAETGGDAWVQDNYRGGMRGRCLILGYAPTVWDEAAIALQSGAFDSVVASPEAARHWPAAVTAIARSDEDALRISAMLGHDEFTFCGRTGAKVAA
ncbi:MAG TPA: hypothetical protein VGO34_14880 [Alphaproteobacteria bacterium]|jgi:hypothetical protein